MGQVGDRSGEDGSGGDGSGKNGLVGDGSVRNGSVAKKVAADLPPFNWFLFGITLVILTFPVFLIPYFGFPHFPPNSISMTNYELTSFLAPSRRRVRTSFVFGWVTREGASPVRRMRNIPSRTIGS
jgi:hypothetical protein